jgi:hypothetical protein
MDIIFEFFIVLGHLFILNLTYNIIENMYFLLVIDLTPKIPSVFWTNFCSF